MRHFLFFTLLLIPFMSNSQHLRTEIWFNESLYPFSSQSLQLSSGKMHFVDEGEGEVILFVHGTPTWSFLYRNQIQQLSSSYRCIAPDNMGFGLSEKPEAFAGTPQAHSQNLSEFVEQLGLDNITLVVHDFGGPIGLSFANRHPEKIKRIVLLNTWLWETASNPEAQKIDKLLNGWLGRFLYLRMNFSPKTLLKQGFADKQKLSKEIHRHYTNVFPDKSSRYSLLRLGQSLVGSSDWYQEQWDQLDRIATKPWLIVWGSGDRFFPPTYLEKWRNRLPQAEVYEVESGHFLQEEQPAIVGQAIESFMKKAEFVRD